MRKNAMMAGSDLEEIYLHETARSIRCAVGRLNDEDPVWLHAPGVVGRAFASLLVDDAIRRDLAEGVTIEHWIRDRLTIPKLAHWLSGELTTREVNLDAISTRLMREMIWSFAEDDMRRLCAMAGSSRMLVSMLEIYVMDVVDHDEVTYADLLRVDDADVAEFTRLVYRSDS